MKKYFIVILCSLAFKHTFAQLKADDQPDPNVARLRGEFEIVRTQELASQNDEMLLDVAYQSFSNWSAQAKPYGTLRDLQIQGETGMAKAVQLSVSRIRDRCVKNNDPSQAAKIVRLIQWVKAKPDITTGAGGAELLSQTQAELMACAQFELYFESHLSIRTRDGVIKLSTVADFPLHTTFDGNVLTLSGSGSLDYTDISWPTSADGCKITGEGSTSPISVPYGAFDLNLQPGVESITGLGLELSIPTSTEKLNVICPKASSTMDSHLWWQAWNVRHMDIKSHQFPDTFNLSGWLMKSKRRLAEKLFQGTGPAPMTEDTQIRVLHRPQK